ncbi:hypothetical protein DFA_11021 [Cavenderia fasciculata]|uniref:Uncharacterized protein n=1 Tax=Cavenderia fasciculata TaxID=261658 RepID=F4QEE7_CACFS|nr:uncharacterized protein DFA_11021 [Cavenderia fasciculata]EGG13260.1 hypothetical protein DFA_11021 [Cavenderia fasciculata]|eukprot:XP_004349959.1 hypothetical protein DFA_11021 [Cavenderia fasciculata]
MSNNSQSSSSNNNNKNAQVKAPHPMLDPSACKELKDRHDACFYKWYGGSFLKGNVSQDCQEEWEEYQVCIKVIVIHSI